MGKRLSGNMNASLPMTRGEYNRGMKTARKDGVIEGIALGKKDKTEAVNAARKEALAAAVGWCKRQIRQNATEGKEAVKCGMVSNDYLMASDDDLNIIIKLLEKKGGKT